MRGRQRRRRDFVGRLLQHADPRHSVWSSRVADDRLPRPLLSAVPEVHGLLETAPQIAGVPILVNLPFAIDGHHVAAPARCPRGARANNIMVVIKLAVLGLFVAVGAMHIARPTTRRLRRTALPAFIEGAAIVFLPASASTRSRRRPRRRAIRSGICPVVSSAGSPSAR